MQTLISEFSELDTTDKVSCLWLMFQLWVKRGRFIGVTAIHALLVYVHHGTAPEIADQINVGVARGEIVTEAISQATKTLEVQKAQLAQAIHQDIVSQVKRDLGFYPIQNTIFDRNREAELNLEANMPPEEWEELEASLRDKGYLKRSNSPGAKKAGLSDRLKRVVNRLRKQPTAPRVYEQTTQQEPAWKAEARDLGMFIPSDHEPPRNPRPGAADITLAKRINPLAAAYRACPGCGDNVPLTLSHCAVCGTEMLALPQPTEDGRADDASFPAGE